MTENGADVEVVLALETSCDETAVALLDGAGRVLSSRIASQEDAHRLFGGVVPEIAARAHLENLPPLLDGALADAGVALMDVSAVAATAGPGLVGALLVGLSEGKGLALGLGVPFVPVNHIEGHALSPFLDGAGGPAVAPGMLVAGEPSAPAPTVSRIRRASSMAMVGTGGALFLTTLAAIRPAMAPSTSRITAIAKKPQK